MRKRVKVDIEQFTSRERAQAAVRRAGYVLDLGSDGVSQYWGLPGGGSRVGGKLPATYACIKQEGTRWRVIYIG